MIVEISGRATDLDRLLERVERDLRAAEDSARRAGERIGGGVGEGAGRAGAGLRELEGSAGRLRGSFGEMGASARDELLGMVGPAAAATAGIGALIAVGQSFRDAFDFKANLDAQRTSITTLLGETRNAGQVFQEASQFARQYGFTQAEITAAVSASVPIMRASAASTEETVAALARLSVLNPAEGIEGAAFALKELTSGDVLSLVERFGVSKDQAYAMRDAIAAGGDAVAVLSTFLDGAGVSMQTLVDRTTGLQGKLNELKQAEEDLALAQAAWAEGPGLDILQVKVSALTGLTRVLTGDYEAMGQSLTNSTIVGVENMIRLAEATNAPIAHLEALRAVQRELQLSTSALTGAGGESIGTWDEVAVAVRDQVDAVVAADAAARTAAEGLATQARATQEASVKAEELRAFQAQLASIGASVRNGHITAAEGADILAGKYRLATGAALDLVNAQAALAKSIPKATDALSGGAAAFKPKALTDSGTRQADIFAKAFNTGVKNKVTFSAPRATKGRGGGGGGGAGGGLSKELKDQQTFTAQSIDLETQRQQKLLDIEADFAEKRRAAQAAFTQDQLDDRASFYERLGSVEDQGLAQAMSAKFEAANLQAQEIARTQGADAAQAYLDAAQAAIEKEGALQQKINEAEAKGDSGKAEYLRGVLRLEQQASEARLRSVQEAGSKVNAEYAKQLADLETKTDQSLAKLEAKAQRAGAGGGTGTAAPAAPGAAPTAAPAAPGAPVEQGGFDVGLLIGKLDELKTSNVSVGRAIESAVKSLKGSVLSG